MLDHLDWDKIRDDYVGSGENYVVIDDFLPNDIAHQLHAELLKNKMWRVKNPVSKHLHNRQPKTDVTRAIVPRLQSIVMAHFDQAFRVNDFWAMLYSRNTDGNVHADFGELTLTYWLTDDAHNLDTASGGLVLYDVKRPAKMKVTEYLSAGGASRAYVDANSSGEPTKIPYKFNRAIIFNPCIFHKSDTPKFDLRSPETMRMNMTISFGDPIEAHRQLEAVE